MTPDGFEWCHCGIFSFLSFIDLLRAMADNRPQRYSIWIGKKYAPYNGVDEIQQLLKDNGFKNYETHTRNWGNGGYIVSCLLVCKHFSISSFLHMFLVFHCQTLKFSTFPEISGLQNTARFAVGVDFVELLRAAAVFYGYPSGAHNWVPKLTCPGTKTRPARP